MSNMQRVRLMLRWSLMSFSLVALFWGVWYIFNGSVPVVFEIPLQLDPKQVISLPSFVSLSRWWDVLLGPLYSIPIVLFVTSKYYREHKDTLDGFSGMMLTMWPVIWIGSGLFFGLIAGVIVTPLICAVPLTIILVDKYPGSPSGGLHRDSR